MYIPTPADTKFVQTLVDSLNHNGIWGLPSAGLVYRVDKVKKLLILIGRIDGEHLNLHERNREVFHTIGYSVLDDTISASDN